MTQVLWWLLRKCGFPHPVQLSRKLDAMLLTKLKHQFCHVNLVRRRLIFCMRKGNRGGRRKKEYRATDKSYCRTHCFIYDYVQCSYNLLKGRGNTCFIIYDTLSLQNECGPQEKMFSIHSPGEVPSSYTIQIGDEALLAPLGLFYPDLLRLTGPKTIITQKPNPGDPDDPFDESYLRETSVRLP